MINTIYSTTDLDLYEGSDEELKRDQATESLDQSGIA